MTGLQPATAQGSALPPAPAPHARTAGPGSLAASALATVPALHVLVGAESHDVAEMSRKPVI
jgi:hypothetical protein